MKKLMMIFFALITISQNVFAISGLDDWGLIKKSPDVMIQHPTFAGAFGPQGLFNVCATEDEFKSIVPVKTCSSFKEVYLNGTKDYACAKTVTRPVILSRTYIQNVCVRHSPMTSDLPGECLDYENVTSVYPTSFSLPVIDASEDNYGVYLFSKTFAIPDCR